MKTKKIIVAIALFLAYVHCFAQKIISKPLPHNPTSYVFKVNIADVIPVFENYCYRYNNSQLEVSYIYYRGCKKPLRIWPVAAKKALFKEENKYNVYMEVSVDSSNTYFNKKGEPFEYKMECVAHFTSIDSNTTKMEIEVLSSKLHTRNELLPSPPHFVNNPIYKKIKPTSIEEYKILLRLGKALGVSEQMPALKLQ